MDVSEKNYVGKRLLKMFFWQKMKSWWGKDNDQRINVRSLTLLIFAVDLDIVWSTTTRTRVSDATAVTFSVKCFNPLKLCPLPGNIFRKWLLKIFAKMVTFSKSYARKQKWVFFSEHSVHYIEYSYLLTFHLLKSPTVFQFLYSKHCRKIYLQLPTA